jgi:glycine/D-amino acid oxidase-like deaminating enzyme
LADSDSLRYYPAYEPAPLAQLGPQTPVAALHHLQLLLVQRPDGGLTIGDTHAYGEPFDFALCEDPTHELLARARRILGTELPPVQRRWEGVYAQCIDGDVCLREEVQPGVWLVTGPGGRGMTCSPAIAADTLAAAGVAA